MKWGTWQESAARHEIFFNLTGGCSERPRACFYLEIIPGAL
ncbi:MAG: hypothetical protein V1766_08250 [Pseudomonadota bacterium]